MKHNLLLISSKTGDQESEHVPIWVDDCIVKRYFKNQNTSQKIPYDDNSSGESSSSDQIFEGKYEGTLEQKILMMKTMGNDVRELAASIAMMKNNTDKVTATRRFSETAKSMEKMQVDFRTLLL